MDEPPKRPLDEDPDSPDSLANRDRGVAKITATPNPAAPGRSAPAARIPRPASSSLTPEASAALAAASAALAAFDPTTQGQDAAREAAPGQRKLIDLFPPAKPAAPVSVPPSHAPAPRDAPYEQFYGLSGNPFDLSPDPRFHFRWDSHEKGLRDLAAALERHDGTLLLTGEAGVGKTTLCRALVAQLGRRTLVSFAGETAASRDVLEAVLVDFGVISRADAAARLRDASRQELASMLRSFLASLSALQAVAIIVIDDAHRLAPAVLADLQVLSELAMEHKLLQVLLVGEPALAADLRRTELQPWDRRVRLRAQLAPLAAGDVADYVAHRLAVAGTTDALFDEASMARIYELSRGLPRGVNLLCDRALAIGARASARVIDEGLVDQAARDLGLLEEERPSASWRGRFLLWILMAGLVLTGAAAAWMFREPLARMLAGWLSRP